MILELKGIYKEYQQGKMSVPVLKNINGRGGICGDHGSFWFWQDNTYEYHWLS